MNGDHVNNEKATAEEIKQLKRDVSIQDLGEKALSEKTASDVLLYLAAWNAKKIEEVGGNDRCFKGGNTEMMAEWAKLKVDGVVLLANKANASILQKVVDPSKNFDKLSEVEQQAFDDKKGQGGVHVNFFREHVDKNHPRFPDTNNTRFGSHGLAATEVIKHLELYRQFDREDIPYKLCAMTLYSNVISHPYLHVVHGAEVNALDLGPLHVEVQAHIQKLVDNPDLLFGAEMCYEMACLDGKEWEDPDAVNAVFKLAPSLPHLMPIMLAFFGFISPLNQCMAEEKHLAWMPATNDVNEGMLGYFRVGLKGKPLALTLHQFNAQAMYSRNGTCAFMTTLFDTKDHQFIMKVAREMDSSGLEAKRRATQVEFCCQVVQMNKEKEEAKRRKEAELLEKLRKIPMIKEVSELNSPIPWSELDPKGSWKWTGHIFDLQLDALRFRKVPLPKKSQVTQVAEKLTALWEGFELYVEKLKEMGHEWPTLLGEAVEGQNGLEIFEEQVDQAEIDVDE
ncbi:hypothetical protein BDP27DRAFT_1378651 [Rhodocollybia butyracea]|uniref:Uncharacterized protein n=1 Tax=Rhodocollybia butyracea TaxID=206335 RepID=A0A9P5P5L9_9AGAR|nr:hypothetical protein BDP27DRAFT_1378651 [Rhodocollybia butyracea]